MKTIKLFLGIAIVAMAVSCQQSATEQPAGQPEAPPEAPDHSALVNSFLAAMDANDSIKLFANCAADFIVYHPNYPAPLDRAAFMTHIRTMNAAFTGAKHTALETISSADAAATLGSLSGKHTGILNGIPPSNNDITVAWLSYLKLDETGKATELHVQFNQISFLTQLGVKLPVS